MIWTVIASSDEGGGQGGGGAGGGGALWKAKINFCTLIYSLKTILYVTNVSFMPDVIYWRLAKCLLHSWNVHKVNMVIMDIYITNIITHTPKSLDSDNIFYI